MFYITEEQPVTVSSFRNGGHFNSIFNIIYLIINGYFKHFSPQLFFLLIVITALHINFDRSKLYTL